MLAKGKRIEVSDLPSALYQTASAEITEPRGTLMENEAKLLKEALENCNWNKKQAALRLGISRNAFYRKLKKYNILTATTHLVSVL